jgi:thiol:disulfide interchange protein
MSLYNRDVLSIGLLTSTILAPLSKSARATTPLPLPLPDPNTIQQQQQTTTMVKFVESEGEWMALMEESKSKLVVVDFTASW